MPKGFRTLDGPKPEYASEFNLLEHSSSAYPPRTEANVRDSDATLRFAEYFQSSGEKCTLRNIKWHNKVHFDVNILNSPDPSEVTAWIIQNQVKILNIAGNSEDTSPGIEIFVKKYLIEVFQGLILENYTL